MPPIVVVERADDTTVIGDGRGRVSYAIGMGWPAIPAVFLKERKRRTPQGRAAGQKLVVMNGVTRHIKGLPEPTRPIDDFSVALWAFAELVLEKNKGLEVAQINYWGGRALHNLYEARDQVLPKHTVAQLWFFHNAALYVRARKQNSWAAHVLDLDVHADGSLWRRVVEA